MTDLLPYIQQVTSALYKESTVQQLTSRTLLAVRPADKTRGVSSSLDSANRVRVGVSASVLSEPLRAVVPEVFEVLEKEQVRRSLELLQDPHPPATSKEENKEEDCVDIVKTDTLSLQDDSTQHHDKTDTTSSAHTPPSSPPDSTI